MVENGSCLRGEGRERVYIEALEKAGVGEVVMVLGCVGAWGGGVCRTAISYFEWPS